MSLASLAGNKAARRAFGTSRRAVLLVVLSCGALLGVGAVPASAAVTHQFEFSFNGSDVTDTPSGPFSHLGANAFDQAGGAAYVLDWGRSVVDKFNANGTYAGVQLTGASTPAGSLSVSPFSGVAVDNSGLSTDSSNGDLYVGDTGHGVVDKVTASGSFVCQITGEGSASTDAAHECSTAQAGVGSITPTGLAVDSSGNLWLADSAHDVVDEFDSAGNYTGHQITDSHIANPGAIALDASGNLYVTNPFSNVVQFDATGAFVRTLDSNFPLSVGVDPATAHVYVAGRPGQIAEYDPSGNLLDTFGNGRLGYVLGLAVRGSSGEIYADDFTNSVVDVFGPDLVIPDVATGQAAGVQQFFATLNGTVDPAGGGNVTSCEFEYGTSTSYGQSAPCSPATPYASATNVSAALSALQPGTTYHFRVEASNANGILNYGSDQTFATPAAVATGQATNVTASSATLGGTVDPDGTTITDCHFEYVDDANYNPSASDPYSAARTAQCASTPSGSSPAAVSADVTGLAEGTTYHFRLVAANANGSYTDSPPADQTFTTLSRPVIDAAYTSNLTSSSVDLNAQINPKGFDSTYHFEWGTSTSYGNSVPVPDADIGSGSSDVPVTQHVDGLAANTTYHWRVVATNSIGTTDGQDHTFVYEPATPSGAGCPNTQLRYGYGAYLPDCRAYEQVSPVDKNGNDVANAFEADDEQQASVDGDRVFYQSVGAFPGTPSGVVNPQYLGSRGASGWSTRAVDPPFTASRYGGVGNTYALPLSPDLSTGVLSHGDPPLVAGAPAGYGNIYVGQLLTGSYQLVTTTPPPNQTTGNFLTVPQGASADFSHVIFLANDALTPNAPPPSYLTDLNLYEWVGGQLRLVGQIPTSGTSCTGTGCTPSHGLGGGAGTDTVDGSYAHAISADGSRVVFSTGRFGGERHIYDRLNGTTTVDVSASQRTSPVSGTWDAAYHDASVDGSHVLFTSAGALTNDAVVGSGVNLYDYNVDTGQLTDLTPASEVEVKGVVGVSDDASHVYFVADGVLASGANSQGATAVAGKPNLYLWHGGQTTFIATLDPGDGSDWATHLEQTARVAPDGAHLAFHSVASPTGYDNTDASTGRPDPEVFLYDAAANRLRCASCNPSGARPIGPSDLHYAGSGLYQPRNLTADGSRLFFTSRDALVPADTNGLWDVYEWEADGSGSCQSSAENGGCLYLISAGRGTTNSYFADSSPSGNDVFFETGDRLVGQDRDDYADLYDARVDGGLASQNPPPAPPACSGEGCLPAPTGAPLPPTAASVTFFGPGNAAAGTAPTGRASVLTRTAHGTSFLVTVTVPGAGRITITGAGVRRVGASVRRAGTYRLRLTLTATDERLLARRHRVRLTLRVAYAPAGAAAQTASVRLTVMPAVRHASRQARRATANTIRRVGK